MDLNILEELEEVIKDRKINPKEGSYVSGLINNENDILEKIGEECTELLISAKDNKNLDHEAADLIFHIMVLYANKDREFNKVLQELRERRD
ncbi:MAG: Phosphoribosyl-ATP pyrophosphohydrolase [Candidatus Methanohalarchaeum thermophilum]|uniref:Phosphoribosyl-ATP pyrophosphatase n=1 Tax=Methanohalarchaeum thermophilum TaxID=1903181 RepID=A0A1Q6DUR8_METT1|nr:MAG: Phosphoribosyl-ATP pyrophosphohydrolase [Candidatus Methanohalarchaeum thermophilum]